MKKFLIYFFPGARGDFLANILLDGFKSVNPDTPAVLMPFKDYVKVHRLAHENELGIASTIPSFLTLNKTYESMFEQSIKLNLIKIRILTNTFEDRMDCRYFHHIKTNLSLDVWAQSNNNDTKHIEDAEKLDLTYRNNYDYIVNFDNLFDLEFIKNFYLKIYNEELDFESIHRISKNISVQQRWSRLNT